MNLIMLVLLALLAVALAVVAYVALRQRIMFMIGLRNIPRRRAQTILIVLGLMLSSLIISAAFTTGDTVSRSLTAEVYDILGHVDETIQVGGTAPGPSRRRSATRTASPSISPPWRRTSSLRTRAWRKN